MSIVFFGVVYQGFTNFMVDNVDDNKIFATISGQMIGNEVYFAHMRGENVPEFIITSNGTTIYEGYDWSIGEIYSFRLNESGQVNVIANNEIMLWFYFTFSCDICSWVTSKGGVYSITLPDTFEIMDSFIFQIPPDGFDFIPTLPEVYGIMDYYLGFIEDGNSKTRCDF